MAEKSAIAWTHSTFNPWIGCTKVGPGCDHCYAEALDKRHKWRGVTHWGSGVQRMRTSPSNWNGPLKWEREAASSELLQPWRVFCASLADVFDNEVPREWRYDLWRLIEATPHLSWLLVTKRIGNVVGMIPVNWEKQFPDNVRLLITVCNQPEADRDVGRLLALPCKNGVSYEPALGPVDWRPFMRGFKPSGVEYGHGYNLTRVGNAAPAVQWVIVGGESTQGAGKTRPFYRSWADSTIRQCQAANVPVFVKQMGSFVVDRNDAGFDGCDTASWPLRADGCDPVLDHEIHGFVENHQGADCRIRLVDRAGADPAEWPVDLRVQEFPA